MAQTPTDVRTLMSRIADVFVFNAERYPPLADSKVNVLLFALNHSLKHISKNAGVLAAQCEGADHGNNISHETLKQVVAKLVLNALNLANILDMSSEELVERMLKELH